MSDVRFDRPTNEKLLARWQDAYFALISAREDIIDNVAMVHAYDYPMRVGSKNAALARVPKEHEVVRSGDNWFVIAHTPVVVVGRATTCWSTVDAFWWA